MGDWSELHRDILLLIVRRINLIEDFLNFGTVCKSWKSVTTRDNFNSSLPRAPWLMISVNDDDDDQDDDNPCTKFFSLYNGMNLKKWIPEIYGKRCLESMGWLITVGIYRGEISLLHPFSRDEIELPHQCITELYHANKTSLPGNFVQKAVLSANPFHTSDFVLMTIQGEYQFLSFWRPGDPLWTRIRIRNYFSDVVYFSDQFYAITCDGCIQVCDVFGSEATGVHVLTHLPPWIDGKYYILESLGSLFVVSQDGVDIRYFKDGWKRIPQMHMESEDDDDDEEEKMYADRTTTFLVFQIDLATCNVTPIRDLGDQAFFLGANASLSVQASQFPGIKPNHIYFTDNYLDPYIHLVEGGGLDMGVFNLADGSIQPHYNGVCHSRDCPPVWITPTPC
ncbi:hypothetical protein HAX54_040932 [Datura stramonium]|uniref:DUF295 domain-containing protein n=1 Tax=Datura stramonium TaxID=4076 RepID=A0ABS8SKY8_DATST|nr:hypothetical protein [Datura stramonium]